MNNSRIEHSYRKSGSASPRFSRLLRAIGGVLVLSLAIGHANPETAHASVSSSRGSDAYGYDRADGDSHGQNMLFRGGLMAFKAGRFGDAHAVWRYTAPTGHPSSQYMMGHMHRVGLGVEADLRTAFQWYARAAIQDVAAAQYRIGVIYLRLGRLSDALGWWTKAAKSGYRPAQYNVGLVHLYGQGAEKNLVMASKWLHRAANFGSARAQFYLGAMYLNGEGVAQDIERAQNLLKESRNNGFQHNDTDLTGLFSPASKPLFAE